MAATKLPRMTCVSPYLGELHAPWRWLEVQDAIKKVGWPLAFLADKSQYKRAFKSSARLNLI